MDFTNWNTKRQLLPVFLLSLPLLLLVRVYLLDRIGLAEYDSVHNFTIVREMANGNFAQMFKHSSPTFFLLCLPVYQLFGGFLALEYFTALLSIAALFVLLKMINRHYPLSFAENLLLLLYMGTSLFLIYDARSFTIDSLSLLLFMLMMDQWLQSLEHRAEHDKARRHWRKMWVWTAILLTVNYKVIVLLPIFLLVEGLYYRGTMKLKDWLWGISVVMVAMLLLVVAGTALGNPWWSYPAQWYVLLGRKTLNPTAKVSTFHWDIDYYFRYCLYFENPLLLPGIVAVVVYFRRKIAAHFRALLRLQKPELDSWDIWLVFSLCLIAGMSIVPKAPRGILFIYPWLYFLSFQGLKSWIHRKWVLFPLLMILIGWNVIVAERHIYRYAEFTNYSKIAAFLEQQQVKKLAVTVGINVVTFLPEDTEVKSLFFEQQIKDLRKQGYEYALADDYFNVVNAQTFEGLRQLPPVLAFKEPTLQPPLLYLEHSEFTGLTLDEMLALQQKTLRDSFQLRLIRIPD